MSAGATEPNETVARAEHTHDDYPLVDGVDLSDLQLDDDDYWLYMPLQCPTESAIQDLYAWLRTEPELDVRSTKIHDNGYVYTESPRPILQIQPKLFNNRKCIDTRTFTRPKKRSARMSFESIFEGLPPSLTDIQKLQDTNVTHAENVEKCLPATIGVKESVPLILKPFAKTAINVLSDESSMISGQESMEAFLNMSQSKGIDSFINLGEPEFNDLLMNISQPSILSTSVISSINESIFIKNDTIPVTNNNMAQSNNDMKEDSNSGNVNETFVMQNDSTITLDEMYRTITLSKEFLQVDKGLNETYNARVPSGTSASRSSLDKGEMVTLSSTFVTQPNVNAIFVQSQNEASNGVELDTTYISLARDAERSNSPVSIVNDTYVPTMRADKADLNVTCDILSDETESAVLLGRETHAKESTLDTSFKVPTYNQSTPMNTNVLNAISKFATKQLDQPRPIVYPMLKVPTSLRRELLAEIQRSGERKLDSTYNHIPSDHPGLRDTKESVHPVLNENETNVLSTNRYHTYKKTAFTATTNQYTSQNEMAATAQEEMPMDQRKFYTFTKKSNPIERTDNIGEGIAKRPNMDSTFCKPILSKAQQKRNILRTLSKLPQFLQKSNPNLVSSSLRSADGMSVGRTGMSSIGYIKGSQPNIVQNVAEKSQLPSRLQPYGKIKSGSEQRLLESNVNTNSQFPTKDVVAGSTESIESTHSIHSAPDLDDRLSACSDSSSHNSCTKQTMNIKQIHKLVRMQEESLKQDSALKPNRQVLENTWVEAKTDLPSPILKNGGKPCEIDRHLLNIDLSMKCSSPLISPTASSQALNNDGNVEDNITKIKDEIVADKTEDQSSNQVIPKIENKTRLRQPTNWSIGSKPAAVISGIPRPASRIPALRFVRPNAKTTQADWKKGCT